MRSVPRTASRADRLREYEALLEQAHAQVAALGLLVRAREARASTTRPLEIEFAETAVDGRALPAGVWVALRGESTEAALEVMTASSQARFVVEQRETVGEGFRLETVEDSRPVPEVELLVGQLSVLLAVPADVLQILAGWGADDPRTAVEIVRLLGSRFGSDDRSVPPPAPARAAALTLGVADAAEVLQLSAAQRAALSTLVRHASVTIVPD